MNSIEKQKGGLVGVGVAMLVASVILLVAGIIMLVFGVSSLLATQQEVVKGVLLTVFGALAMILFIPALGFGIYCTWIGGSLKATRGSIKQGNIAKQYGTVNMKKCDRCGTELKEGETVCSECQKSVENK